MPPTHYLTLREFIYINSWLLRACEFETPERRLNKGANGEVKGPGGNWAQHPTWTPSGTVMGRRLTPYNDIHFCLSLCLGYYEKITQTVWLQQQKFISQFWRLEDQGHGAGGLSIW